MLEQDMSARTTAIFLISFRKEKHQSFKLMKRPITMEGIFFLLDCIFFFAATLINMYV